MNRLRSRVTRLALGAAIFAATITLPLAASGSRTGRHREPVALSAGLLPSAVARLEPRRPRHGGDRRAAKPRPLLHGRRRRRRLAHDRCRRALGAADRRPDRRRHDRRGRGRALRSQRHLRRHRIGRPARQRHQRRRRLQVDRRRQDVDAHRPRETPGRSAGSSFTRPIPNIVFVAALGNIFGPNPERGVYRTNDGGKTWEQVLKVSDRPAPST